DSTHCPSTWDGVSCWYKTLAGQKAIIPCFSQLLGVDYDTTQNATRMCLPNGTWANRADYGHCKPLNNIEEIPIEVQVRNEALIFNEFINLQQRSSLRSKHHPHQSDDNLSVREFHLIAICWITTDRLHANPSPTSQKASCITVIMLTYLMGTNFFWMFVEGLYLYILVVKTFSIELVKISNYLIIGWILPLIVILLWSLIKFYFSNYDSDLVNFSFSQFILIYDSFLFFFDFVVVVVVSTIDQRCPYQAQDSFDYIYKVPILIVLMVLMFFCFDSSYD
ncbi:diuretic hormone receptor-like protein, partial [Sarcoptes scabiei]